VSSSPAAPAIARIPAKAWGSRLPCARDLIASPIALEKQAVPILARKTRRMSGALILSTLPNEQDFRARRCFRFHRGATVRAL